MTLAERARVSRRCIAYQAELELRRALLGQVAPCPPSDPRACASRRGIQGSNLVTQMVVGTFLAGDSLVELAVSDTIDRTSDQFLAGFTVRPDRSQSYSGLFSEIKPVLEHFHRLLEQLQNGATPS